MKRGGTNNTLQVTVRGTGQTVLHIWNENDALVSGFLRINTGLGILPHKVSSYFYTSSMHYFIVKTIASSLLHYNFKILLLYLICNGVVELFYLCLDCGN